MPLEHYPMHKCQQKYQNHEQNCHICIEATKVTKNVFESSGHCICGTIANKHPESSKKELKEYLQSFRNRPVDQI